MVSTLSVTFSSQWENLLLSLHRVSVRLSFDVRSLNENLRAAQAQPLQRLALLPPPPPDLAAFTLPLQKLLPPGVVCL